MPRYSGAYRDSKDRIRPITPRKRSGAKTGVPVRPKQRQIQTTKPRSHQRYREDYYQTVYMMEFPSEYKDPEHLNDVPTNIWKYAYLNETTTPEINPLRFIDISSTQTPTLQNMRDNRTHFKEKKGVEYEIKLVSPNEYFNLASQVKGFASASDLRATVTEKRAQEYAKAMRKGDRFPLPWIDYDYGGQEGRHRARALEIIGVRFFPVMIIRSVEN